MKRAYQFIFISMNLPDVMSSLKSQGQAPIIHLSRQITRTTAETMESSWFYWLELSCQRYWVFIYSISQLVYDQASRDINLLKHRWTQGDVRRKTVAPKPMHPSSEAESNWHKGNIGVPGFWRLPSEQEVKSRRLRKQVKRGGGCWIGERWQAQTQISPPYCTGTHFVSCVQDKEQLELF